MDLKGWAARRLLRCGQSKPHPGGCIAAEYKKILKSKPEGVWTVQEFSAELGLGSAATRVRIAEVEANEPDAVVKFWGDAPSPIIGIKVEAARRFMTGHIDHPTTGNDDNRHADDRLKCPMITKKDLTPASEDLKRTGRARCQVDED